MKKSLEQAIDIFQNQLGKEQPPGDWFQIDQARIDQFAEVTVDHNYIHIDVELSAEESPYETTIAHGFLTLSLMTHLVRLIPETDPNPFEGVVLRINYGFNRVRFITPVKVDSRIRTRWMPIEVVKKGDDVLHLTYTIAVEIENEERPACVADWILRLTYD